MTWINDTSKMRIVTNVKYENNGIFPSYFSTYHDFFDKIRDYMIFLDILNEHTQVNAICNIFVICFVSNPYLSFT